MFEAIKISELDQESLALTKTFVQSLMETCDNFLPGSTGQETITLGEMRTACAEMLQKINFDLSRRSVAEQAAAVARQRQPQFAQAVNKLEQLLKSGHNYEALTTQGKFGGTLEVMRERKLALLRDTLSRHLGQNATLSPQVHNSNFRIRKIADYIATFDSEVLYAQNKDQFEGFRKLVKAMRKDIMHKGAMQSAVNAPKTVVTPQDITIPGVTIARMTTVVHKGISIPYTLDFDISDNVKKLRIEVPGLTGGGAPMTKHLKEFLDGFGNEASAYDAINYCKSWLTDLKTIPFTSFASSVNAKTKEAARIFGRSQLRWEFVMSKPHQSSNANYKCHHIVAKGIKTGMNHYQA